MAISVPMHHLMQDSEVQLQKNDFYFVPAPWAGRWVLAILTVEGPAKGQVVVTQLD
jgi:hypothetical protein